MAFLSPFFQGKITSLSGNHRSNFLLENGILQLSTQVNINYFMPVRILRASA